MAKNFTSKLNILLQQRRSAIQLYTKEHPEVKSNKVAPIFHVSPMTVLKWRKKDSFYDSVRKRKNRISRNIKYFLLRNGKNKFSGIDNASCRKLATQIERKLKVKISFVTVNNWLKKLTKRTIKVKKTFFLKDKDKKNRLKFKEMINEKKIQGKDIFFTDEKRFI